MLLYLILGLHAGIIVGSYTHLEAPISLAAHMRLGTIFLSDELKEFKWTKKSMAYNDDEVREAGSEEEEGEDTEEDVPAGGEGEEDEKYE
jgi:hypothetical protein